MGTTGQRARAAILWGALVCLACPAASAADAPRRPAQALDSLQQAVVDSLAHPPRTTAPELFDAAIRTANVEADRVALDYFERMIDAVEKAGDNRLDLLADLGDSTDTATLLRLARRLRRLDPDAAQVVSVIQDAAAARRRDPQRLATAAAALSSATPAERKRAIETLSRGGTAALPALVDLLQTGDAKRAPARAIARELVVQLGPAARRPLVSWLGSPDVGHWQGAIEALAASNTADVGEFLLAPALVPGTPPAAQRAAIDAVLTHEAWCNGEAETRADALPSASEAISLIARRLDRVLCPGYLVSTGDRAPSQPADQGDDAVFREIWNPATKRLEKLTLTPRAARSLEAMHLARDLGALDARDPEAVHLALLARLEAALVAAGDPATALATVDPARLVEALTGPDGLDPATVSDVLEMAIDREMPEAAAAALRVLEGIYSPQIIPGKEADEPPVLVRSAALPEATRRALVRLLEAPDETLAFAAARALARCGGDAPYAGASRMVARLARTATSLGVDRAVVAHADLGIAQSMAANLSRYGYEAVCVATGHAAVKAARENSDTTLVLLGNRLAHPGALETVQFLRQPGSGDIPPVMIVVEPLDDLGRGRKLTHLLLSARDYPCLGIVDRRDSFFHATLDPVTGEEMIPARFPAELAALVGPEGANPAWRQARAAERKARAAEALELLTLLGRQGFDVSATLPTARDALVDPSLAVAAAGLLGTVGAPEAQEPLLRQAAEPGITPEARAAAAAAFRASVERFGLLLDSRGLQEVCRMYNSPQDGPARDVVATLLATLPGAPPPPPRPAADAAFARPIR